MDPIAVAMALLDDPRTAVREKGVAILAESQKEEAETLLVAALGDASETIWTAARRVLRYRQPWLALDPFNVRQPPAAAMDTSEAGAWSALKQGLEGWLTPHAAPPSTDILSRWAALPGAVPDLVEALETKGFHRSATQLANQANLYGCRHPKGRQVLLCPTYNCNLNCSYCYARDWNRHFNDEMSLEDLDTFFSWCSANQVRQIIMGGGEPTVYRHLGPLLTQAAHRRIWISLTSNNLFPKAVADLLTKAVVGEFIAHFDQGLMGNPARGRRFERNLRLMKERQIPIFIRYTLTEESDAEEWSRVIELADRFEVPSLNYAFAFKNILKNNAYVRFGAHTDAKRFNEQFRAFFESCHGAGLRMHLCKPIPLCLLEVDFLRDLLLTGSIRTACAAHSDSFSRNLTVNPDLSTLPCNAIGVLGPKITATEDLERLSAHHAGLLRQLLFVPFFEKCSACFFSFRGFCQGVCLAEKFQRLNSAAKRAYYVLPMPT